MRPAFFFSLFFFLRIKEQKLLFRNINSHYLGSGKFRKVI